MPSEMGLTLRIPVQHDKDTLAVYRRIEAFMNAEWPGTEVGVLYVMPKDAACHLELQFLVKRDAIFD